MTKRRAGYPMVVLATLFCAAPAVRAQVPATTANPAAPAQVPPTTANPEEQALMRQAETHMVAGQFAEALPLYARLFGQTRDPVYLRNLARCHQLLQHPDEAILNFRQYLATPELSQSERTEIEGFIREMEALKLRQQQTVRAPDPAPQPLPMPGPAQPDVQTEATPAPAKWRTVSSALMATGAVAIGTGVFFSIRTKQIEDEVTEAKSFDQGRDESGRTARNLQFVGYGVGAALVLGGVALRIFGDGEARTAFTPSVGPHHASLTLRGKF